MAESLRHGRRLSWNGEQETGPEPGLVGWKKRGVIGPCPACCEGESRAPWKNRCPGQTSKAGDLCVELTVNALPVSSSQMSRSLAPSQVTIFTFYFPF